MKRILFVIPSLAHGGAEKVLVNLVNHMDRSRFDITVMTLFDEGINRQFLAPHIQYKSCFGKALPGNSHAMKLFSPSFLFRRLVKDKYDGIVAYLEGPAARIVSGCPKDGTKLFSWIHITQGNKRNAARAFRSYREARRCYERFDAVCCVARTVKEDFQQIFAPSKPVHVLYNTLESDKIRTEALEEVPVGVFREGELSLCGVGKLLKKKGFDRLARIHLRLRQEGFPVHTYVLGIGPEEKRLKQFIEDNGLQDSFTLLGYDVNPYRYVARCDVFVCSSLEEGFSTAATEALILGCPVVTTRVSGAEELLGNNEFGMITDNEEEALYQGIRALVSDEALRKQYAQKALERGSRFSTTQTVWAVEALLENVL